MEKWDPEKYDAWYRTPVGKISDKLEKSLMFSLAGVVDGEKALDAGCGTGIYSLELAKRGAVTSAIDASEGMLGMAKKKALEAGLAINFVSGDAMALPFPDGSFDLVVSEGMFCFVKEREKALAEISRVLRPGGRVVIGVLNKFSPWAALRRLKGLFRETVYRRGIFISPGELVGSLAGAGFQEVEATTCVFFLPIRFSAYLRSATLFEKIGLALAPWSGAFLAAKAIKKA